MMEFAPSTGHAARQTTLLQRGISAVSQLGNTVEHWLEQERSQLPLWVPVVLASGIGAWFALPQTGHWIALIAAMLAIATFAVLAGRGGRIAASIVVGALLVAAGCLLIWAKALLFAEPPLAQAATTHFAAVVKRVDVKSAQAIVQLHLAPRDRPDLPLRVRVNVPDDAAARALRSGAVISLRARLMPPAPAALPGAYDFARRAYFDRIGATGRAIGPIVVVTPPANVGPSLRNRLADHIRSRIDGGAGALAVTLATGDRGDLSEADTEALQRSSLAHLLSISGLHVTAVVGAAMLICLRLLALFPAVALRLPLMLVSAGAGAAAGIGYTLLTGAEVPTLRSCIAALLVLLALALGRDPIGLRTLASAAIVILLFWPEAAIGPSFQFSFTAVAALIAVHESPRLRTALAARDEHQVKRVARITAGLFVSGLAVEIALAPIALFHFHQTGLLGAIANMIAIPLTTFVIMPAEALALLLDIVGLGAPAWAVVDLSLRGLLRLAHVISAQSAAVMVAPASGAVAFGVAIFGLYWALVWRSRVRLIGLVMLAVGLGIQLSAAAPDIVVTADGRHVAVRTAEGNYAMLRDRTGDYARDTISEIAGQERPLALLSRHRDARCNADACIVGVGKADISVTVLMTRSDVYLDYRQLIKACRAVDIVISQRNLPAACKAKRMRIDRAFLRQNGGVAIFLDNGSVRTTRAARDDHPWVAQPRPTALEDPARRSSVQPPATPVPPRQ